VGQLCGTRAVGSSPACLLLSVLWMEHFTCKMKTPSHSPCVGLLGSHAVRGDSFVNSQTHYNVACLAARLKWTEGTRTTVT
jgi:hypothetical protein